MGYHGVCDESQIRGGNRRNKATTVNSLPPEVIDLIITQLERSNDATMLDYFHCLKALGPFTAVTCDRLRKEVSILRLTNAESNFVDTFSNTLNNLGDEKELPAGVRNLLIYVDENWLETKIRRQISVTSNDAQVSIVIRVKSKLKSLIELKEQISYSFPNVASIQHVIMECDCDTIDCSKHIFDIFQKKYYLRDGPLFSHVTILNVQTLKIGCNELDDFFRIGSNDHYFSRDGYAPSIANFLKLKVHLPELKSIEFVDHSNSTCWNIIDLTQHRLDALKAAGVRLQQYFDFHSFRNWDVPMINYFSGHELVFDECRKECEGCRSRFQRSAGMIDNLRMLRETATRENPDGLSHFNIHLVPDGVLETTILNWIPFDDYNGGHSTSPPFCLRQSTLNKLRLGIVRCKRGGALRVEGFYLPKLEKLEISFSGWCHTHSNAEELFLINFSTWNYLPECRMLRFSDNSPSGPKVVVALDHMKAPLPKLTPSKVFPRFFDGEQIFVIEPNDNQ